MKSILVSSINKNKVIVKEFEEDFKCCDYRERRKVIENEAQNGTLTEMRLDGVSIIALDLSTTEYSMAVQHDFPLFKLQFEIEGSSLYTPSNPLSLKVAIPGGHYNLFYLPEVNGELQYKTNYRKTLEIVFTENYIKKIIGKDFKAVFLKLGKAITEKVPFLLWETSKPITPELQIYVQDILHCKYCKSLKKPYLEAKVNELLIYLLANTNEDNFVEAQFKVPKDDYQHLMEVENYIRHNLDKQLTIPELALIAGMNTSKLKHSFKAVFDTTIFKYITQLRMEKAKALIVHDGFTVSEAAFSVGYKHPQHFTAAFKKIYGCLPSSMV
ncbi:AraC family transcriptional regulator [Mangrovimonas sp. TPBH4]|uniref:helix-turn-helix domain-containing protein n=1 Tax=Mangrovimonas sp. TPBH4 TaxID=1645914 RepID=UPI0006B58937|nr:AraC family transcriptional regulator [Mangrovimonas sp. TPBH4]